MLKKSAQQIASFTSTLAEHLQSKTHLFVVFRQFFFFVFARTLTRAPAYSLIYMFVCVAHKAVRLFTRFGSRSPMPSLLAHSAGRSFTPSLIPRFGYDFKSKLCARYFTIRCTQFQSSFTCIVLTRAHKIYVYVQ